MKKTDLIYGIHAVESLLVNQPDSLVLLTVAEGKADQRVIPLLEQAGRFGISVKKLPRKELDLMCPAGRHQGVIATVTARTQEMSEKTLPAFLEALDEPAFLLVLDGVQDPHNLGACLRTADAAGVHAVILPKDRAVGITPVVHKVASGAVQSVPVFTVTNLARTLRQLKDAGIWLYGASDAADEVLYATDLGGPAAFILGSEGKGLRRLTLELCDYLVAIPMAGQVESLNVSVPIAIVVILLVFWSWQLNRVVGRRTAELVVSEEKLRGLIDFAPVGIVLSSPDGKILEANPEVVKMFGYQNREELLAVPTADHYLEPAERGRFLASFKGDMAKGFETQFKRMDGSAFWGVLTAIQQKDEHGDTKLLSVFEDITERKAAEIELEKHRRHLEELIDERTAELRQAIADVEEANRSLAFTQAAVDGARDALIFIRANDASFVYVSDSACKALGYKLEELLHMKIFDVDPDFLAEQWDDIARVVKDETLTSMESRQRRKNGEEYPVEISLNPIGHEDQDYIIANVRDTTERKEAEETLKQYMDDLERFNRMTIGREKQIIGLKQEINTLLEKLGQEPKYKSVE